MKFLCKGDETPFSDEVAEFYQSLKEQIGTAHYKVDLEVARSELSLWITGCYFRNIRRNR